MCDILGRVAIDMCEFPPSIVGGGDEVGRVVFSEDGESLVISALFDVAVASKISTREAAVYQVLAEE